MTRTNAQYQIALAAALDLPEGEAPEWVHLLPAAQAEIRTFDGRGPYRVMDPSAVIAASFSDPRDSKGLILDENHAADKAAVLGLPSPARGKIVELQARADGIWGRVDWTEAGRALVNDRAYRGISPVFLHDKSGIVTRVLRASLVNNPNLRGLAPLHMENPMPLAERLAELLGKPATTSEDDLLAAIPKPDTAIVAAMAEIATAYGVDAADPVAVANAAKAAKSGTSEPTLALQAELTRVSTAFTALQSDIKREKATAFVDAAIARAAPGVKPLRDHYIARHMEDPAGVEKEMNAFPSLGPSSRANPGHQIDAPAGDLTALNAEQQGRALHDRAIAWQSEQKAKGLNVSLFDAITHVKKDIQL